MGIKERHTKPTWKPNVAVIAIFLNWHFSLYTAMAMGIKWVVKVISKSCMWWLLLLIYSLYRQQM